MITKKYGSPHCPFVTRCNVHFKLLNGLNAEISKVYEQHPGLWSQKRVGVIRAWPTPISDGTLHPILFQYHLSTLIMSSVNQELCIH